MEPAATSVHSASSGSAVLRGEYAFTGFFSPIDNLPVVNSANAGQAIPVKWRLLDSSGGAISDPTSFLGLTSYLVSCTSLAGDPVLAVEEYAPGYSGLQYLGDGNWHYNWKTPKDYANQCRVMVLTLKDGSGHSAQFTFRR